MLDYIFLILMEFGLINGWEGRKGVERVIKRK